MINGQEQGPYVSPPLNLTFVFFEDAWIKRCDESQCHQVNIPLELILISFPFFYKLIIVIDIIIK